MPQREGPADYDRQSHHVVDGCHPGQQLENQRQSEVPWAEVAAALHCACDAYAHGNLLADLQQDAD